MNFKRVGMPPLNFSFLPALNHDLPGEWDPLRAPHPRPPAIKTVSAVTPCPPIMTDLGCELLGEVCRIEQKSIIQAAWTKKGGT